MNSTQKPHGNCYNIPAGTPFLPSLARWILQEYGSGNKPLVNVLVLLPNRRSCRALREAFLAETQGKPLLLPKIQPIGDIHEDTILHYPILSSEIPATISATRRELLLTQLVRRFSGEYSAPQTAELARHLGRFMDDALREGVSFDRLSELVPADLSIHWQQTLKFLTIITHHWPTILASEGVIDPIDHRNRMLKGVATAWEEKPPSHPVIAAGSTGSQPAIARLLATISRLPKSAVILSGVDTAMENKEWELISETHPQYGIKELIITLGCKRSDIISLPSINPNEYFTDRATCLHTILQSPDATAHWPEVKLPLKSGLTDVQLVTADTQFDEARMIGIALRETLKTPGKTTALVTSDRTLAQMVIAQMQRYGIDIDDSAGYKLMDTPPGCLLRLCADMAASQAAPSPLLALLRHPLTAMGMQTHECRRLSRVLEIELLRGIRRAPGLEALLFTPTISTDVKTMLETMNIHLADFSACFRQRSVSFKTMLEIHITFAEWLASTPDKSGKQHLWSGEAGNQMAEFIASLMSNAELMGEIDPISYPRLLEVLMNDETYRPRFGRHPRLHILGPIEARLLHFDRVILGGLNEGSWPSQPQPDPWMSRPMRGTFGLPVQERQIGQSAHDLYMLCSAPEVLLTRANKMDGTPTVPSRWLVRLETLMTGLDPAFYKHMRSDHWYEQGKKLLDAPIAIPPGRRPEPCPPLIARPRKLRITAIDTWLRDPYMVYAQHILKLRKLDPLDKEPGAADFGTLVHKALEMFSVKYPSTLPDNTYKALLECGLQAFSTMLDRPAIACLWWPRFEGMAEWLLQREQERRGTIATVLSELEGKWEFTVDGKPFTLTTRIDRLEMGNDGCIALIDYKTGILPTKADIDDGIANQLLLEALVAKYGVLTPAILPLATISALEYWKLSGQAEDCEIKNIRVEGMEETKVRLENLIRQFDSASKSYAAQNDPSLMPRFNDYQHLTRRSEWEAV